jgi:hypothetical protein
MVLDAASASYTHVSPRGEVVHHRVPFACSTHVPQLRVMLDLYNSMVDRPLLCVRSAIMSPSRIRRLSRLLGVLTAITGVTATLPECV